jgi:farnesol dehydrogenase
LGFVVSQSLDKRTINFFMNYPKKVFVTGATGFLGKPLAKTLADSGNKVIALYRSIDKTEGLEHSGIELFQGDITEPNRIKEGLEGCHEVFHLAALANQWAKDPAQFTRVNYEATVSLLNNAQKAGVQKIVVTSTAGVIGPSNHLPVNETTDRTAPFFGDYERTKKQAEDYIRSFPSGSMQVVMVNPTRVYGPGVLNESNSVTKIVKQYIRGQFRIIPGRGDKIGNYAFVDDVVTGHLLAMERGKHGERYLLGGENIVFIDLFKKLDSLTGKSYKLFPVPKSLIFGIAHMMEWRASTWGIPPLLTPGWARKFIKHDWEVSSQKAIEQLGYQITPLEEGLRKTINWLEQEGLL